jgi:hypothetical protein
MGKKIKKAIKKVTKAVTKVADPGNVVKKLAGNDEPKQEAAAAPVAAPAPVAAAAPAPVAAANVEAPKDTSEGEDDADTDAAKKAARAKGKRGLSVARSAGTGINI